MVAASLGSIAAVLAAVVAMAVAAAAVAAAVVAVVAVVAVAAAHAVSEWLGSLGKARWVGKTVSMTSRARPVKGMYEPG